MSDDQRIWPVACATGHRRLPRSVSEDWVWKKLLYVARKLADQHGLSTMMSGMALGVDQMWADAATNLAMPLHAAVPYPSQAHDPVAPKAQEWTEEQREFWQVLIDGAAERTDVSPVDPTTPQERVRMLHERNRFMVEHSQVVVAVWMPDNLRCGTAQALRTAVSAGRPIIWINPVAATEEKAVTFPARSSWARRLHMSV